MEWIDVDDCQPTDESVVLVYGVYKDKQFISIGKYEIENNWWTTLAEAIDFIMIELTHDELKESSRVKVKYWMPLPEPPDRDK